MKRRLAREATTTSCQRFGGETSSQFGEAANRIGVREPGSGGSFRLSCHFSVDMHSSLGNQFSLFFSFFWVKRVVTQWANVKLRPTKGNKCGSNMMAAVFNCGRSFVVLGTVTN